MNNCAAYCSTGCIAALFACAAGEDTLRLRLPASLTSALYLAAAPRNAPCPHPGRLLYACALVLRLKERADASKIAERIESLDQRLQQLKAQQQRLESRRRSLESRRARREDTRRKILVGAVVLAKVDQGVLEKSVLRGWLNGALERADDRALFGL